MTEKKSPTRGVPVELDRTRHLRYSLGALRAIREDDELGDEALDGKLEDVQLGRFLWHGLRHEDEGLTVEQVEDMVDLQNLTTVTEALQMATGGVAGGNGAVPPTVKAGKKKPAKKSAKNKS